MTHPKILMLPSSYLPESIGGTETYVHWLASELTARGVPVHVAYHSDAEAGCSAAFSYSVERLGPLVRPSRTQLYGHSVGASPPGFRELLDRMRPDIIHFHAFSLGAGVDHANVLRERNIPYIVTYHHPGMSCLRGTLIQWGKSLCDGGVEAIKCSACVLQSRGVPRSFAEVLARLPFPASSLPDGPWSSWLLLNDLIRQGSLAWRNFMLHADQIVVCAEWCVDVLRRNQIPQSNVTVLRQAVPGEKRRRKLRIPDVRKSSLRLGYAGRIDRLKGPDLLLQAAVLAAERGIEIELEFAGPVHSTMEHWFPTRLQRVSKAAYVGIKQGADLGIWLATLDALVIPSRCLETGPLILLEAWDQSIPVLGADLGGIREFILSQGLPETLFEPENPASIVDAIQRLMATPKGTTWEVEIAGVSDLARQMLTLYERAIDRRLDRLAEAT